MKLVPLEIRRWEKAAAEGITELFRDGKGREVEEKNLLIEELYREIGRLKVELDSSQKKAGFAGEGEGIAL